MAEEDYGPPESFKRTIRLMAALGFDLPYERMRQSQNVIEAIPGTTRTTTHSARSLHLKDFDNPLSRAAGYEDLPNPWVFERRAPYRRRE